MDSSASTDKEGPPPAKRRRISKERSTEYLDLRSSEVKPEQQEQLDRLLQVLHIRQKIVVIAGAGISVSAGSKLSFKICSATRLWLTPHRSTRFPLVRWFIPKPQGRTQTQRLRQASIRRVSVQR
jgi:hypothetical protein